MTDTANRRLAIQPVADTETVESLVRKVIGGQVRIPSFQRGLKWKADDVRDLYDSLYVGYPVGSLLLRKASAEAGRLTLGPLEIRAPETQSALWVVDGQQRLVSLAAGLARPTPLPTRPEDPYVLYFDAASRTFRSPNASGVLPSTWVPVPELLDATRLSEWVFNWTHAQDADLRKAVFDAGARIRQYSIPRYTVETDDVGLLKEIFFRINKKGQALEWTDVHDAMFGDAGAEPSTLAELSARLTDVGMGTVPTDLLLSCVVASRGLDPTQDVSVHYEREPDLLRGGVRDALPALRSTLAFLQHDAEIPHVRLLPVALPVPVLVRFFARFPEPNARVRTLLARWTWRVMLEETDLNRLTLLRRGILAIEADDAERAVQDLLTLTRTSGDAADRFEWPERFDARSAKSRFVLLGMASLKPADLATGRPLDVAALVEANGGIFPRIWGGSGRESDDERRLRSDPVNRILVPGTGLARATLLRWAEQPSSLSEQILNSHGIDSLAREALRDNDLEAFDRSRFSWLNFATRHLIDRMVGAEQSDRVSIEYLLAGES